LRSELRKKGVDLKKITAVLSEEIAACAGQEARFAHDGAFGRRSSFGLNRFKIAFKYTPK
jgi:SOS response regulatory protein OraA/RecX